MIDGRTLWHEREDKVWERAILAAERFWLAAQKEPLAAPLSAPMRRLAARNLQIAGQFAGPLRAA